MFNQFIKVVIVSLSLLSISFVNADLQDALKAYESENFESAHQQFLNLAQVGNADAFYNLGVMYYKGQHVDKDYKQAYAWMKLANQADDYFKYSAVGKKLQADSLIEAEEIFVGLDSNLGKGAFQEKFMPEYIIWKKGELDIRPPKPLVKYAPMYPERALRKAIYGWAIMSFRVNPDGKTSDVEIINEYPKRYDFGRTAKKAIRKFKYEVWDTKKSNSAPYHYVINTIRFENNMSSQQRREFNNTVTDANTNNAKAQYLLSNHLNPVYGVIVSPFLHNTKKTVVFESSKITKSEAWHESGWEKRT